MRYAYRDFYGPLLKQLGTRKALGLLVFPLGVVLTLISTPFCGRAFLSSRASKDGYATGPLTLDSKICLGTRAVVWTAELPLLSDSHFYVVHHILSLSSTLVALFEGANLRPVYLIYSGLITEVFSSSRAFIRGSGLHHTHPKLFARITIGNAVSILLLRTLPAIYVLNNQLFRSALATNLGMALCVTLAFYGCVVTHIAYQLLAGQGYVSFQSARPAHFALKIGKPVRRVSVYSVLLGTAMASAELSSATLYELASSGTLSQKELSSLASIGLGTVISGLLGARVMNWVLSVPTRPSMEQEEMTALSSPVSPGVSRRFFPGFKGLSIQGAILFSTIWLTLCPILGFKVNYRLLFGAVGLSLPIGEAVGRIGCYFAGCCGPARREQYPGIQLLAAVLNMAAFSYGIMYLANHGTSKIGEAGLAAVQANAAVRLVLNPLRSDAANMPFNPASAFAVAQIIFSSSMLALEMTGGGMDPLASSLATIVSGFSIMFTCRVAAFAWEKAATQLRKWKLSRFARLDNLAYAISVVIFVLGTNSSAGDEVARARSLFLQKEALFAMSNPALLGSAIAAAGLPILLLN